MAKSTKLFDEIRNFIVFFLIFGLWPSWPNSKRKVFFVIYSLFHIGPIICIFWLSFYVKKEFDGHSLSSIVQYIFLSSILLTHFAVILEAFINRNAQMRLVEKISHADWLLKTKLQLVVTYREEKQTIFVRLSILFIVLVTVRATFLLFYLSHRNRANDFWLQLYSICILRFRVIQILFFVQLLRTRLRLVREKLKEILVTQSLSGKSKDAWQYFRDTSTIFVLDASSAKQTLYNRLLNLKQIHGELHEICELINITFGWSLLTIIAQSSIEFTGNSYCIYLAIEKSDFLQVSDCLTVLLPIIILLVTMVYYCSSCSRYVSRSLKKHLN